MFENIGNFFKRMVKPEQKETGSKDTAKERLHLVLMQDRANVSADFLELMKQEIIDVIKKYIIIDETAIDVRLTNQSNEDGTNGAPALYANIPILNIKNDMTTEDENKEKEEVKPEDKKDKKEVKIEEDKKDNEKVKSEDEKKEESTENKVNEEEDFDLTFDDLLKAAEEENIQEEKTEENDSKVQVSEEEKTEENDSKVQVNEEEKAEESNTIFQENEEEKNQACQVDEQEIKEEESGTPSGKDEEIKIDKTKSKRNKKTKEN